MEVCLILSIFKGYANLLIFKIMVSFDKVLKVSTESDMVSGDVSSTYHAQELSEGVAWSVHGSSGCSE